MQRNERRSRYLVGYTKRATTRAKSGNGQIARPQQVERSSTQQGEAIIFSGLEGRFSRGWNFQEIPSDHFSCRSRQDSQKMVKVRVAPTLLNHGVGAGAGIIWPYLINPCLGRDSASLNLFCFTSAGILNWECPRNVQRQVRRWGRDHALPIRTEMLAVHHADQWWGRGYVASPHPLTLIQSYAVLIVLAIRHWNVVRYSLKGVLFRV
jgi:hypothetical protein